MLPIKSAGSFASKLPLIELNCGILYKCSVTSSLAFAWSTCSGRLAEPDSSESFIIFGLRYAGPSRLCRLAGLRHGERAVLNRRDER